MRGERVTDGRDEVLRGALDALPSVFAVVRAERDDSGAVVGLRLEEINAFGAAWLRGEPAQLLGRELGEIDPRLVDLGIWGLIAGAAGGKGTRRRRLDLPDAPAPGAYELTLTPYGPDGVIVDARDVSETARAERLLTAAYEDAAHVRATLQTALDATTDAFAVYDVEHDEELRPASLRLVMINAAGAAPLGSPDELAGRDLRDFYPKAIDTGLWQAVLDALASQVTRTFRVHEHHPDGTWAGSWENRITPVSAEQAVITWRDVSDDECRERSLAEAHELAQHAATHDPLTGLANRALLTEQLAQALTSRDSHWIAVVYLDLDSFKTINDTHGHATGDLVLRAIAERLTRATRSDDTVTRLGGDEFCVVMRTNADQWDEERLVRRIQDAVEQPLHLDGLELHPRTSIGAAVCPPEPADADHLLRTADARMYADKTARHTPAPRDPAGPTSHDPAPAPAPPE